MTQTTATCTSERAGVRRGGTLWTTMDDPAELEDSELLDRWANGDEAAGNALVERHFDVVYRFFRHRVAASAGDLVQRTFLACVESRDSLHNVISFRAFLLGIARNHLLRHLRKEGVRRRAAQAQTNQPESEFESMSGMVAMRQEQKLLVHAMRHLSLDLQLCLELHYWEDMTTAEIAAVLGIPRGTVLNRLFRARNMLRAKIVDIADDVDLAAQTARNLEDWARSLRRKMGRGDDSPSV